MSIPNHTGLYILNLLAAINYLCIHAVLVGCALVQLYGIEMATVQLKDELLPFGFSEVGSVWIFCKCESNSHSWLRILTDFLISTYNSHEFYLPNISTTTTMVLFSEIRNVAPVNWLLRNVRNSSNTK